MSTTPRRWPYTPESPKDPDATLDYQIDWSDWLGDGETLASVTWIITGATSDSETNTDTAATIWLSGGTVGEPISATCRVTTTSVPARIDDRTLLIEVKER